MRYLTLVCLCLLTCSIGLYAQNTNHLDLLFNIPGEFDGDEFGNTMAAIDFNKDGYQDLAVTARCWNAQHSANQPEYGKVYFYWGGPGFDNVPDLVFEGQYAYNEMTSIVNAGDVDGDGFDDLLIMGKIVDDSIAYAVQIFFAKPNPTTTPDRVLCYPYDPYDSVAAFPLGDIDGDNKAEVCIRTNQFRNNRIVYAKVLIWYDVNNDPSLFRQYNPDYCFSHIEGLGDINGDGYDDCYMRCPPFPNAPSDNVRQVIYFGGDVFPADSLVVTETTPSATTTKANPLGDVNGDGYDDFSVNGWKLYFGGETINLDSYITFTNVLSQWQWHLVEGGWPHTLVHADLNHDGYEDTIGSDTQYQGENGVVTLWMGRASMNGIYDLNLFPPAQHGNENFGWAKAIADFNNDGITELAFSTPWYSEHSFDHTGYVHIYAANDDLHDTPATDEVLPVPTIDNWSFSVYPNPLSKSTASLNIRFLGSAYKTAKDVKVEIVNIKGERVVSKVIPSSSLNSGQWHSGRLTSSPLPSGVYLIRLSTAGQSCASYKVVVVE